MSCSTRINPITAMPSRIAEFDAQIVRCEHRRERRASGEQNTRQETGRSDPDDLARQSCGTEQKSEEDEPRRISQRVGNARRKFDPGPKSQSDGDAKSCPKRGGDRRNEEPGRAGARPPTHGDAQCEGKISGGRESVTPDSRRW